MCDEIIVMREYDRWAFLHIIKMLVSSVMKYGIYFKGIKRGRLVNSCTHDQLFHMSRTYLRKN